MARHRIFFVGWHLPPNRPRSARYGALSALLWFILSVFLTLIDQYWMMGKAWADEVFELISRCFDQDLTPKKEGRKENITAYHEAGHAIIDHSTTEYHQWVQLSSPMKKRMWLADYLYGIYGLLRSHWRTDLFGRWIYYLRHVDQCNFRSHLPCCGIKRRNSRNQVYWGVIPF